MNADADGDTQTDRQTDLQKDGLELAGVTLVAGSLRVEETRERRRKKN